ncbi:lactadherin-like isoform X2 [Amphiura filiformis]|uniref:lactadherin-like isoform X2 n=1 Tax=Amphiura filiformis TaxID=82378 RepID=UPI003B2152ED
MRMEFDVSFVLIVIFTAYLTVVQSYICILREGPDPSRGGALRWSLPYKEVCFCQGVVAYKHVKACPGRDLWFVDDPSLLIMRQNWETDILDELMNRTKYCDNDECLTSPCDPNAVCSNNIGGFECTCNTGFSGDGLNCSVCSDPLGMNNDDIRDGDIKASAALVSYEAVHARLDGNGAWVAPGGTPFLLAYKTQWIEANIGYQTHVSGIITQGDAAVFKTIGSWVSSFKVSYFLSVNGNEMFVMDQSGGSAKIFPGNSDPDTKVTTTLPEPIYALIIRITCLVGRYNIYAIRFEVLGCKI